MTNQQTETRQLILDTANRIFTDRCDKALLDEAERGVFAAGLWQTIVENGFHQIGSRDSGTDAADLFAFLQTCGRFAVPLPLAGTLLVNRWCGATDDVSSVGLSQDGEICGVAWGRNSTRVVGLLQDGNAQLGRAPECVRQHHDLAGEALDDVACGEYESIEIAPDPFAQMALAKVNLIAGSLQTQLDLGILFATERVQFGRPISKFQAIQHSLALIAAEVAAAKRAADAAVDALDDARFVSEVAASKARVGEAVTCVAEQVHQIHGAMGFTHEHRLHHFSRRSWAWRDAWGNEFYWQQQLGQTLCQLGADNVWDFIATQT